MSSRPQHYRTRYRDVLTPRQREILELMAKGHTNPEIAERFGISLDGAKWHVGEILAKLGVDTREEAAALWREQSGAGHRLRETLSAIAGARLLLRVAVGAAIAGVAALVAVGLLLAGRDGSPASPGGETPSPPPAALDCPVADDVCTQGLLFADVLNRLDAASVIASITPITVRCPPAGEVWLPYAEACAGRAGSDVTGYRYFGAKAAMFYADAEQFREPVELLRVADDGSRVSYRVVAVGCPGESSDALDCSTYTAATLAGADAAGDVVRIVTIPFERDPGTPLKGVGIQVVPEMADAHAQGGRGTTSFPLVDYPAEMIFRRWDAAPLPTDPCDPANLVAGFIVVGTDDAEPACVGEGKPIPGDARRYEIAVPPGPYNQVAIDEPDWDGWRYLRNDTGDQAFAIYRSRWTGLAGRVVRASSPPPVAFMPGPAVRADANGIDRVWWQEGDLTYRLEVSPAATGLDLEQVAALLAYFTGVSAAYWDPAAGNFREENRPVWLYDESATTGVAVVDAEIADGPGVSLAGTIMAPCVENPPPAIFRAPPCPAGAAAGTLVEAYLWVGCPGAWAPVHLDAGPPWLTEDGWLYAVFAVSDPALPELAYAAVYTTGERVYSVVFSETRVLGAGGGGGCPTPDLVPWARTVDSWLLPPLYPLPPAPP